MTAVDPLDRFREIVFVDAEFIALPSERPDPVCVCATLLRSGQEILGWRDELGVAPPYPVDDDVLFVSFAAAAELEVHLALGWSIPKNVLDLRVEHINQTGFSEKKEGQKAREKSPRALLDVLRSYGITDGDAAVKTAMRDVIMTGQWPAIEAKRDEILRYCLSDASVLRPLLGKLVPRIRHFDQALRRGEYVAFTAEVCP